MIKTVSSGGVVLNEKGDVLVVSQHGNSWSLPKGKLDPGEDKLSAAKREIYEESGVSELEMIKELGTYKRYKIGLNGGEDKEEYKTITLFLFKTSQIELDPQDGDNPEAKWVKADQVAPMLTHPRDKEFYEEIMHEFSNI
jgi:ADP-ribose pyrophosphatase YjhB (NUDIX family)